MNLKIALISFTIAVFLLANGAEPESGSICVASRAATPFRGQVIPPSGEVDSHGLRLRIDKRPAVPWPQRESLKIEGLELRERHLLAIVNAQGKPIESMWFRFSNYEGTHLCLAYDEYQGIGLQNDDRHTPWCKCKQTPDPDKRP